MLTTVLFFIETILLWSSVVGATLVLVTYVCLQNLLTQPMKLVVSMSACISIGYTVMWFAFRPLFTASWMCTTLAMILHYFLLANVCWSFAISMNFYQVIVRRNRDVHLLDIWYHLCCWGIPLIFCGIVIGLGGYGSIPGSNACYIVSDWLRFGCFIVPALLVICCNAILFSFIGMEIHATLAQSSRIERTTRREELRVYFTVFVSVGLTWCSLFALYLVPEQPIVIAVLRVMVAITVPSQGVLLFLAYCVKERILRRWAAVFGCCIPCCMHWADAGDVTTVTTVISSAPVSPRGSSITTPHLRTTQHLFPRPLTPVIYPPSAVSHSVSPVASPPTSPTTSPRVVYESTRNEDGSLRV